MASRWPCVLCLCFESWRLAPWLGGGSVLSFGMGTRHPCMRLLELADPLVRVFDRCASRSPVYTKKILVVKVALIVLMRVLAILVALRIIVVIIIMIIQIGVTVLLVILIIIIIIIIIITIIKVIRILTAVL